MGQWGHSMRKKWLIKNPNPKLQIALSDALNIHPLIAQILINRKIESLEQAQDFLSGSLSNLHDPFLLKDMDRAVNRIHQAQDHQELILIFGDYDVDGVTSSVVLKNLLSKMGLQAIHYIPHRMQEGYGLNQNIVGYAKEKGVSLLITVDCGIGAFREVEALHQAGIDVIIFDHHEPDGANLPNARAVVDPKRHDCPYPFKGLASVGLMAKLHQALTGEICEDQLDLVTIGTIADVAELIGENRILVKNGLPKIGQTQNYGLQALLEVAKIKGKKILPSYVGFILGPRINATGRMDSALPSLELLLSPDSHHASRLARSLEEHNSSRQKIQNNIVEEAISLVEREVNFNEHRVIVLKKEGWHKGVLGIVASRIMEKYYRPTVVISTEAGLGTGSARSIDGFSMFEALNHCAHHLENYGGHKRAAGLTLREEKIEFFRNSINEFAQDRIKHEDLIPTLEVDAQIPLASIGMDLVKRMESLEPYGEGNPAPLFCSRQLIVKTPPQVLGRDTLKFWVTDGKRTFAAVGFGMGDCRDLIAPGRKVDLAYQLSIDDWNKEPTVLLKLKDIKPNS